MEALYFFLMQAQPVTSEAGQTTGNGAAAGGGHDFEEPPFGPADRREQAHDGPQEAEEAQQAGRDRAAGDAARVAFGKEFSHRSILHAVPTPAARRCLW